MQGGGTLNNQTRWIFLTALLFTVGGARTQAATEADFATIVVPDTQNATDYTHQKAAGFALDSADIFIEEMREIGA